MSAMKYFPYTPRESQIKLMNFIDTSLRRGFKYIFIQAPTGFGKTIVILSTLIPYVLKGYRVIWAVKTGNETDRPIEELKEIMNKTGLVLKGISFRGKHDMCLLARKLGFKSLNYREVTYLCKYSRNKCKFYENVKYFNNDNGLGEPLTYSEILDFCYRNNMCPYYFQRKILPYVNVLSLSYNYIVNEKIQWSIRRLVPFSKSILVIDEAHNLQNINLNSDKITEGTLERALEEASEYSLRRLVKVLEGFIEIFHKLRSKIKRLNTEEIIINPSRIASKYLNTLLEMEKWGEIIRKDRLREGKAPRSSLHHFAEFWLNALEHYNEEGITFIASIELGKLIIEMWDMRASEILSKCWLNFPYVIFCSGTLHPIDSFAEIIGVTKNYTKIEIPSHYDPSNVLVIITKYLTTKGETISDDIIEAYIESISIFTRTLNTNQAIFTSSYRVMEILLKAGLIRKLMSYGRKIFIESRSLRGDEARRIILEFKKCAKAKTKGILIGSMGGRFSEGADFPGKELEAIFLVGIPFDKPTARVKEYIKYYQQLYGRERGYFYGYILPALRKAAQSMGRALRSKNDKAVIVCGDIRYSYYLDLLPDYATKSLIYAEDEDEFEEILEKKGTNIIS